MDFGQVKIANAYQLPDTDGAAGEVIATDGAGVCSWSVGGAGSSGLSGYSGIPGGASGYSGYSGVSGDSGGDSGYSGLSGYTGNSGYSGAGGSLNGNILCEAHACMQELLAEVEGFGWWDFTDAADTVMGGPVANFKIVKTASWNRITAHYWGYSWGLEPNDPTYPIRFTINSMTCDAPTNATWTSDFNHSWTNSSALDCSSLVNGTTYELTVSFMGTGDTRLYYDSVFDMIFMGSLV